MRLVKIWLVVVFLFWFSVGFDAAFGSDSGTRFTNIESGKYRFRVVVRSNGTQQEIQNARGQVTFNGNKARLRFEAKGYRPNLRDVELKENVYYYETFIYLGDPEITTALIDEKFNFLNGYTGNEYKPQNICWSDEICIAGELTKFGFEQFTAQSLHIHINGKHLYSFAPRVFLTSNGNKWSFEIMIHRGRLSTFGVNKFDIIASRNSTTAQSEATYLYELASGYRDNLELATLIHDEKGFLMVQERLESNARDLSNFFGSMNDEEQKEILGRLPAEGDLVRSLKSIAAFAELHR